MSFGNQKYFCLPVSVLFIYLACRSEFHVSPWILYVVGILVCCWMHTIVLAMAFEKASAIWSYRMTTPCLWLNCNIFHHKLPLVIKDEINLHLKINHSLCTGVYIMLLSVRYVNQNNFSSIWISTIISHPLIITFHPSVHLKKKGHLWANMQRSKERFEQLFLHLLASFHTMKLSDAWSIAGVEVCVAGCPFFIINISAVTLGIRFS